MTITHLSDADFSTFIEQHRLVVVDLWAEWCLPCKFIDPVFEELAEKFVAEISFVKIDAGIYPDFKDQFDITGIPSFLFFREGKLFDFFVGADEARLRKTLKKLLKSE